jgi:Carboxypeptidase regulatory-like domain
VCSVESAFNPNSSSEFTQPVEVYVIRVPGRFFVFACWVALLTNLLPSFVVAQKSAKVTAGKASISGQITDLNGTIVGGARAVLSNGAGLRQESTADEKGNYSFSGLHSGTYTLVVSADKLPELRLDYINLAASQELMLDAMMQGEIPKPTAVPTASTTTHEESVPAGREHKASTQTPEKPTEGQAPQSVAVSSGNGNASISGVANDPTGAVIPGATVILNNAAGVVVRKTQTDDKGAYSFTGLEPGTYSLSVTAPNFGEQRLQNVVATSTAEPVQVTLQPARNTEEVHVIGSNAANVEVDTSTVSGTITEKEVVSIGLNGRNFTQLIALAPGVSNQTGQDEAKVGVVGSVKYSVNGGRVEYNTFEVDGSDVLNTGLNGASSTLMVYPSLDSIQEVKVLTSNYGAQFGRTASGTVQVTTKSGGPKLHGNLYDFVRNEAFNSRNFFDFVGTAPPAPGQLFGKKIGSNAPLYRRQDFGGTIGGPVAIPKIYEPSQPKTFFFFSEEFRLEKTPTDYNQAVPGLRERGLVLTPQGIQKNLQVSPIDGTVFQDFDFTDVCPIGGGGFVRAQFPDCPSIPGTNTALTHLQGAAVQGQASAFSVNKNALAILNSGLIPLPNAPFGCNFALPNLAVDFSNLDPADPNHCYNASVSPSTYWREELFRIDHDLTSKLKLSFRYIHDAWDTTVLTPQWGVNRDTFPTIQNRFVGPGTSLVARVTQTLSPTLLNDLVLSYTNSSITLTDQNGPGAQFQRDPTLDQPLVTDPSAPGQCNPVVSVDPATHFPQCAIGHIFDNGFGGKMPGIVFLGTNAAYGGRGFAADPAYMPWGHSNPTYALRDDITKAHGKHALQFGAQFVYAQRNQTNNAIGAASGDEQGFLAFSNLAHSTGNAFADFLEETTQNSQQIPQGFIQSFTQDSGQRRYYQRYQIAEPYVQDDWKVTNRLTLNLGLRISLFGTYRESNHAAWNWDASRFNQSRFAVDPLYGVLLDKTGGSIPVSFNPSTFQLDQGIVSDLGLYQCGVNGTPTGCVKGHLFNPAPRIGFAWDPRGNGKTAIRGGYGVFFEHGTGNEANTGSLEASAPLVLSMTQPLPLSYACIGNVGYGSAFDPNNTACISPLASSPSGPPVGPSPGSVFPLDVTAIPTSAVWPYAQQWSFGIQRELPNSFVTNIAYVGSKGTHLTVERQLNQLHPLPASENPFGPNEPLTIADCTIAPPGLGGAHPGDPNGTPFLLQNGTQVTPQNPAYTYLQAACTNPFIPNVNSLPGRPYPGLGRVLALQNIADSGYQALQFTLRRASGPLTTGISYSYSHSLDDASDRSDPVLVNSYDLRANRASSNFDERHLLNISYVYQLPLKGFARRVSDFAHERDPEDATSTSCCSPLVNRMLDNWEISGVTIYQSGTPFTVINSAGNTGISLTDNAGVSSGLGIAASYPDVMNGLPAPSKRNSQSFGPLLGNPSQFVAPRGLTFGDAGRNFLNNPSRLNFDVTLSKHFKIGERGTGEFRGEVFNLFNQTQFRIYDPDNPGSSGNNVISCYAGPLYSAGFKGSGADCVTGASFLHPLNAHRPRTIQFGLKLGF